jgi:serine/threonine protein kinase
MVCGSLSEAHGLGLIHRDIKPANIMLCSHGGELDVVKLLDFGLVKELDVKHDSQLTQADALTGTPLYLSPEGLRDPDSVDARSDLYALGAVGYFLITGAPVFTAQTLIEVCSHHLHTIPQSPSERLGKSVCEPLELALLSCLEKEPAQRPQSALELHRRLRACRVEAWTADDARAWWCEYGDIARSKLDVNSADNGLNLTVERRYDDGYSR